MYRMIVAHQIRTAWAALARGDYDTVLDSFASKFEYTFVGDHALGGTRYDLDAMRAWFARIFRIFPDISFHVDDVIVRGWPWDTRAVVLVSVGGRVAGEPYSNEVAQTIRLRWGRIVRIRTLENTQLLAATLERLSSAGVEEAAAPPIDQSQPTPASRSHAHSSS
jgi:ketosteroid isomerase-like protein